MRAVPPWVEDSINSGYERLEQLRTIDARDPEEYFRQLARLPWIRILGDLDHPIDDPSAFYPVLHELVPLLDQLATEQRGPGILGYFRHLELSFSMRVEASYRPDVRAVRLNMGLVLLIAQLDAIYRWLESTVFSGRATIPLNEVAQMGAPLAVREELALLYRASDGGLPVRSGSGLDSALGRTMLRFVLAHEVGHLIDFAESPSSRARWREVVWEDYQDALDYALEIGVIGPDRYASFLRASLDPRVADNWAAEFLADGMAVHTLSTLRPPPAISSLRVQTLLQVAVELFFHLLVLAYRGDRGTDSHPPPTLRSLVVRARRRKDRGASWSRFLSEHWGAGLVTAELMSGEIARIGGRT